jgi:sirohydrochlorin cobaltochelatase
VPTARWGDADLLLIGHGSASVPGANDSLRRHAEEITRRKLFARVCCGFIKGDPNFEDMAGTCTGRHVYVVPCLMSDAYLSRTMIPSKLHLDSAVTTVTGAARDGDDQVVCYCDPVGTSPRLTEIIARKILDHCKTVSLDPRDIAVLLVGHGTERDTRSTDTVWWNVETLASQKRFGRVLAAFLEESPYIADQVADARLRQIVAIGFFLASGLHGEFDVPKLLKQAPGGEDSQYLGPIGTDESFTDVILERVRAFDQQHPLDLNPKNR